ncbi:hypothetical protein [Nocardioides sp. Leaf285]|uniref:hypothetical protein n=1 Tax=Nocardioides sp. Leaf285 TaxID=1736322 RepID=UPI000703A1DF|nr:hypothetical protein [Nocardioides sp. Leaf285]KQP63736.1 hypothetical protein ASF47_17255 [Nocardioides sp. Leaf285]
MLRAVVRNFLETLGEREFDAPLLALLASQGFHDIHFTHGGFEFGKDVVAKRADDGVVRQYSIQSKAGDLTQGDWRNVRPQLEECDYNTRAHPSFDANLPRVAVLVTTGVLKGAAAVDAQEYKQAHASRGLADFEVWDRETITDWLCLDPALGLTTRRVQDDLVTLLNQIARHRATEPMLERHTRTWIETEPTAATVGRASIEAAMIAHELRTAQRLDLTAYLALQLYRSAWSPAPTAPNATSAAALRLFTVTAQELLTQAEPFLDDPLDLANQIKDSAALFTYPAACVRLAETFSLLAITEANGPLHDRAVTAVRALATTHPAALPAAYSSDGVGSR